MFVFYKIKALLSAEGGLKFHANFCSAASKLRPSQSIASKKFSAPMIFVPLSEYIVEGVHDERYKCLKDWKKNLVHKEVINSNFTAR